MAAQAAAGHYFVYGRHAGDNREKITGLSLQFKGEVLQKMGELKELTQESYEGLIDTTALRYERLKRVKDYELKHLTVELKNAWTHIWMTLK